MSPIEICCIVLLCCVVCSSIALIVLGVKFNNLRESYVSLEKLLQCQRDLASRYGHKLDKINANSKQRDLCFILFSSYLAEISNGSNFKDSTLQLSYDLREVFINQEELND
ncbi:hypothetical protein H6775_03700 [Candidatus Nomurabacteria bacterium]|nr:hypothetical protein [Candidatus Nomurabacteria bacterium]